MSERPRKQRAENAARRSLQMVEATLRSVARNGLRETTLASVSREAGLSQGVAVFYFESKGRLLEAAFRHHYEVYRANWEAALDAAGDDPEAQMTAIILADFSPVVFNREALAVWYAFWGDSTARPIYAEISKEFDGSRSQVLSRICTRLSGTDGAEAVDEGHDVATAIDAVTDGLWLRAHLSQGWAGPAESMRQTARTVARMLPGPGERIAAALMAQADAAQAGGPGAGEPPGAA